MRHFHTRNRGIQKVVKSRTTLGIVTCHNSTSRFFSEMAVSRSNRGPPELESSTLPLKQQISIWNDKNFVKCTYPSTALKIQSHNVSFIYQKKQRLNIQLPWCEFYIDLKEIIQNTVHTSYEITTTTCKVLNHNIPIYYLSLITIHHNWRKTRSDCCIYRNWPFDRYNYSEIKYLSHIIGQILTTIYTTNIWLVEKNASFQFVLIDRSLSRVLRETRGK